MYWVEKQLAQRKGLKFYQTRSNAVILYVKMDDLADKDFSHYMTESKYFRYKQNWWISLNKSGNTAPMRNRSDFNEALSTLNRLHQESGERQLRPLPFWKYQQRHQSSSSSSSWWQWSGFWWSSSKFKESREDACKSDMIERRNPLCSVFG